MSAPGFDDRATAIVYAHGYAAGLGADHARPFGVDGATWERGLIAASVALWCGVDLSVATATPHPLHVFRDTVPGEGESRALRARMPGEDFVVVDYDDAARGWRATVYRRVHGGLVLAAKAWGEPHRLKRDALAEARSSGIPFLPGRSNGAGK